MGTDSFLGVRNFWGFLTAGTDSYFGVRSFLVVLEVVLRWSKKPDRLVFCIILFSSKSFVQPSDQGLMPLRDCESDEERRGVQTDRGGHALGDPMISRAGAAENYSRVRADGMPRRGGIR